MRLPDSRSNSVTLVLLACSVLVKSTLTTWPHDGTDLSNCWWVTSNTELQWTSGPSVAYSPNWFVGKLCGQEGRTWISCTSSESPWETCCRGICRSLVKMNFSRESRCQFLPPWSHWRPRCHPGHYRIHSWWTFWRWVDDGNEEGLRALTVCMILPEMPGQGPSQTLELRQTADPLVLWGLCETT